MVLYHPLLVEHETIIRCCARVYILMCVCTSGKIRARCDAAVRKPFFSLRIRLVFFLNNSFMWPHPCILATQCPHFTLTLFYICLVFRYIIISVICSWLCSNWTLPQMMLGSGVLEIVGLIPECSVLKRDLKVW